MTKRIILLILPMLLFWMVGCNGNSESAQSTKSVTSTHQQDLVTGDDFLGADRPYYETFSSTHIMIALNTGAKSNGKEAEFGFIPIHLLKGEFAEDDPPIGIINITVKGALSNYDFTDTYVEGELYLLFLEYKEDGGYYYDKFAMERCVKLDAFDLVLSPEEEREAVLENVFKYNKHQFERLEELMQMGEEKFGSSDSTTAE